jgi:hypothetical protein
MNHLILELHRQLVAAQRAGNHTEALRLMCRLNHLLKGER